MNIFKKIKDKFSNRKRENLYTLDGIVPLSQAIPVSIQHVLAMFISNITPMLIIIGSVNNFDKSLIPSIIQNSIFLAGIGTIIQLYAIWKIGARLPIVMGVSFYFVGILSYLLMNYDFETMLGSVFIGGLIVGIFGLFTKYWRKIITPIVSSCVVLGIGLSLLSVGAKNFAGGIDSPNFGSWKNLLVGFVTLLTCLVFSLLKNRTLKTMSILFGIITGYVLALALNMVDLTAVSDSQIFSLPKMFCITSFKYNVSAIVSVTIIYLVSSTEVIGNTNALTYGTFGRETTDKELTGAISGMGFISALASLFGCAPLTGYCENIGLVTTTKVTNKFTILIAALMLIIISLFPILGSIFATVPSAILGGCTIMLFASIVVTGIKMIANCGFTQRNTTIVSLAVGIGYAFSIIPNFFSSFPEVIKLIGENCVATMFIIAFILDLLLPKEKNNISTIETKEEK